MEGLTPLQRSSQCILQPQLTGKFLLVVFQLTLKGNKVFLCNIFEIFHHPEEFTFSFFSWHIESVYFHKVMVLAHRRQFPCYKVGELSRVSYYGNYSGFTILLFWDFFTPSLADGFSLGFEWQQTPQVSRTLLSILADLNNAVVWMVSTSPLISKSSSSSINSVRYVPNAPITIGSIVTFTFHFIQFSRKILVFISFIFTLWSAWPARSTVRLVCFFFSIFVDYHKDWSSGQD